MNKQDILKVIEREPRLTSFGFECRGFWEPGENNHDGFEQEQAELLAASDECSQICEWLADVRQGPRLLEDFSSIGLKLLIDKFLPSGNCLHGACICAAIHMGFRYREECMAAYFDMSVESLNSKAKLVNYDFGHNEFELDPTA